jgi:transcriptional regulator with XRE-family HTH domain
MNLGERIKKLRTERGLTQPQLAEAIGIEQSYLSKLENEKSIPSAEIFRAVLQALAVDVGTFLQGIDEHVVRTQLQHIPEVSSHLNTRAAIKLHSVKAWLYGSAIACIMGLTAYVAGHKGLLFPRQQYDYASQGVVLPGEPSDIFSSFERTLPSLRIGGESDNEAGVWAIRAKYYNRISEHHIVTSDYRGGAFTLPVNGGSRTYVLVMSGEYERRGNRYFMLSGALLAFAGVLGFFVEHRLRSVRL